jgi:hypothetical protein
VQKNVAQKLTFLLVGEERLSAHVSVVLHVWKDYVCSEALYEIVALEFVNMLADSLHREMGPSMDFNTKPVLIEFDILKSLLQNSSVKFGIEWVARDAQRIDVSGGERLTVVLLLSQVF